MGSARTFLERAFTTLPFAVTVTVNGDGTWAGPI
jgi:hypothetical protein